MFEHLEEAWPPDIVVRRLLGPNFSFPGLVAAAVIFPCCLRGSTLMMRNLGMCSSSTFLATTSSITAIGISGALSGKIYDIASHNQEVRVQGVPINAPIYGVASVLGFLLLSRRRILTLAPTNCFKSGPFCSEHVANQCKLPSQRIRLQALGDKYGCHHCGSHIEIPYVADEIWDGGGFPPVEERKNLSKNYFPQCLDCYSLKQSHTDPDSPVYVCTVNKRVSNLT